MTSKLMWKARTIANEEIQPHHVYPMTDDADSEYFISADEFEANRKMWEELDRKEAAERNKQKN